MVGTVIPTPAALQPALRCVRTPGRSRERVCLPRYRNRLLRPGRFVQTGLAGYLRASPTPSARDHLATLNQCEIVQRVQDDEAPARGIQSGGLHAHPCPAARRSLAAARPAPPPRCRSRRRNRAHSAVREARGRAANRRHTRREMVRERQFVQFATVQGSHELHLCYNWIGQVRR